jgi:lipopolysaccharide/colanic/teichoic acid biosynthesis glycosyltransferase
MKETLLMRALKALNIVLNVGTFFLFWCATYTVEFRYDAFSLSSVMMCISYSVILLLLYRVYHAVLVGSYRVSQLVFSQFLSTLIAGGMIYCVICALWHEFVNPIPVLDTVLIQLGLNALWSITTNRLFFHIYQPKPTAIIYRSREDLEKLEEINFFSSHFNVIREIEAPEDIHRLMDDLIDCQAVFVTGIPATFRNGIVKHCIDSNKLVYVVPHVGDVILAGARPVQMFSVPVMMASRANPIPEYTFVKRLMDFVFSLLAIIVLCPIMLVVAAMIKAYDGGPVFYRQTRLTQNGREFKILKFRSMRTDAERDGVARLAKEKDDRITPVGRMIRAIRFDELPQLFNILKGDMTIVGPRPERPEIAAQYEELMPAFSLRLQVKAGLTGYAQVYGRYNTEPSDKLKMDLIYINRMSLIEDAMLILATIKILFVRESTAGVKEERILAIAKSKEESA